MGRYKLKTNLINMEELEVLESIYLDDIKVNKDEQDSPVSIQLQLHPATGDELDKRYVCMTLTLNLPQQYPDEVPDIVITNPRGIAEEEVQSLLEELENLALERVGGEMLYELIELAKESLTDGNVPYCPCTICCEHFTEEDMFTKTDCYHYFHNNCLQRYIKHQLDVQKQVDKSRIQHTEINEDDKREELSYDAEFLQDDFSKLKKDETFYQPSCDMRVWQKNMAELYLKQKDKGGIIDVEAEKNKYLLTDSDNEIPIIVSKVITDNTENDQTKQPNVEKEDLKKRTSASSKFHKTGRGQGRYDREPHFRGRKFDDRYDRNHSASDRPNQRRGYGYRPSSGRQQEYSNRDYDRRPISGNNYRRGFGRGSNSKSPRNDSSTKSNDFKDNRSEKQNHGDKSDEKNGSVEEKLTNKDSGSPRNGVKVNDMQKIENGEKSKSELIAEKKTENGEMSDSTSDKGSGVIKVVTMNESNREKMTSTDLKVSEKDKAPANSSKLPVSKTETKDSSQITCDQIKNDGYRGRGQRKHAGEVNRGEMKSQGRFKDEHHHDNSRWRDQDHYYGNRKYYDDYRDNRHYNRRGQGQDERRGQGQNYDRKAQGYYDDRKRLEPKHRSENNRKTYEGKEPEKLSSSDSRSSESAKTKEPDKLFSSDSKSTESAKKDISNFDKSETTHEQGAKSHALRKEEKQKHIRKDVHRDEITAVPHRSYRTSINHSKMSSDRQEKQGCDKHVDKITGSSTTKTDTRTSRPPGFEVKGPPPGVL
ncbi:AO7 [Mytilus edulis]|uniref:RNF25 n=1 Tax=Mytilus edulis TaxID=6550 RepID=A0A8S3QPG4_MYTED|nr:AO7 [Mytilus edulis]